MNKYKVYFKKTEHHFVEIIAKDEDEAREKAYQEEKKGKTICRSKNIEMQDADLI